MNRNKVELVEANKTNKKFIMTTRYFNKIKPYALISVIIVLVSSCYYDSKEYLFPEISNLCDTSNVTYSGSVQPILDQYCLSCHSNTTAQSLGANIKLENYNDVLTQANNGRLVGTISHQSSYSPMPKGSSKLSDCIINTVTKWVEDGAPNN